MFKKFIFLFLLPLCTFSQNDINLSGKIKSGNNNFLEEVFLELQTPKGSKFAVSTPNGDYKFNAIDCSLNDSLVLKVNYLGYTPFLKTIFINQENIVFDVDLESSAPEALKEVVIMANKSTHYADKSSYKINQKDFIRNAKATEVLNKIPNIFYSEINGVTVDGTLKGKIFIDGIEALANEIKNIRASEVDKVEIINNPSAIYGTDFSGGIINIITKKTNKEFFKGSIEITGAVKNNQSGVAPILAYKKGIFSIKTEGGFSQTDQISEDEIKRNDVNGNYTQNFISNTRINQFYINSIFDFKFSEKSKLTVKEDYGGYRFKGNINGTSNLNNDINTFTNSNQTTNRDFIVASVYKYNLSETKTFYLKNLFEVWDEFYKSDYYSQTISNFDIKSKRKELALNLSYTIEKYKIFNKSNNITYDFKYIYRNYSFSNNDFFVDQNIFNATTDIVTKWSNKFSTQLALTYEYSENKNDTFLKKYDLILPTFNAIYHFEKKVNVRLGFSQKILRPGPSDLNDALIVSSPGVASQGNSNLNQQKRDYYFVSFSKEFEKDDISLKFFRASINNSIVSVYKKNGNLLIRTFDNAAKFNSTGVNLSYTTNLFDRVDVNIESGMNYNVYETDDISAVIKYNSGTSFNNSISISSNLFKDKVSFSFSGNYESPNYTLLSKSISYPYLDFRINTNLFKDKVSLSLYGQNLLGNGATLITDTSYSDTFQQTHNSRNNFTNLLLTLTYNFGNSFENNIKDNSIQNNDIRK